MTTVARFALITVLAAQFLAPGLAHADDPVVAADAIIGVWETEHEDGNWSHVEVYEKDGKFFGRIIWLKNPLYDVGEVDGMDNKPRLDLENSDKTLQNRPIIGLEIASGFSHDGKNKWEGGRIYDPASGKSYDCKITMKEDGSLEIFGYVKVGFVKMGRNTAWVRVADTEG